MVPINTVHAKMIQEGKWLCVLKKDVPTYGIIILALESNASLQLKNGNAKAINS